LNQKFFSYKKYLELNAGLQKKQANPILQKHTADYNLLTRVRGKNL
jgi:hypothetical protein